ncbi:MAG: PstS family phosphate ABC transporter substrate-binding protein [Anaerolineaceae bacterium]|nr:PstS family phosphate ABC transporter substrate-binding protein [Anaerolineaceae bacterium]
MALIVILLLSACGSPNPQDNAQPSNSSAQAYIENKGSDTLVNVALAWAERYQKDHPEVQISVTGGGSGTGFAALINGTIDIANASRGIKPEEIDQAKKNGFEPVEFIVANDAIAVIVNPKNPISELTLEQVSRIYKGELTNWKELGGEDRPIVRLSRETNSGTHVYFLETVIRLESKEDKSIFSADTLLLPSSEGIISEVSDNPNAIGYDGLGYVTPQVKMVALAASPDGPFILPSARTVTNKEYPISRHLFMYTRGEPQGAEKDYLDWILSPEAQAIVTELGFVPVASGQ